MSDVTNIDDDPAAEGPEDPYDASPRPMFRSWVYVIRVRMQAIPRGSDRSMTSWCEHEYRTTELDVAVKVVHAWIDLEHSDPGTFKIDGVFRFLPGVPATELETPLWVKA